MSQFTSLLTFYESRRCLRDPFAAMSPTTVGGCCRRCPGLDGHPHNVERRASGRGTRLPPDAGVGAVRDRRRGDSGCAAADLDTGGRYSRSGAGGLPVFRQTDDPPA
jgi:hypothetical protein